jgi:hypothetical protein
MSHEPLVLHPHQVLGHRDHRHRCPAVDRYAFEVHVQPPHRETLADPQPRTEEDANELG